MKCHQYWPNPDNSTTYGNFQVACESEEGDAAFLVREMTLTHLEVREKDLFVWIVYVLVWSCLTIDLPMCRCVCVCVCVQSQESRQLTQIQYMAWPDHGVPDDSTNFLELVSLVRRRRAGGEEPVVVHCR